MIKFCSALDDSWLTVPPVGIGPSAAADRFLTVSEPRIRVDLSRSNDEFYQFEAAFLWSKYLVIGWGSSCYLVELASRSVKQIPLGAYFGYLYPAKGYLLIASGERLIRVNPRGKEVWRSDILGLDGVMVHEVLDNIIRGEGEWDPPNGWRSFRVCLVTGRLLTL